MGYRPVMLFKLVVRRSFIFKISRADQAIRGQGQPLQVILGVVTTRRIRIITILISHFHCVIRAFLLEKLHCSCSFLRVKIHVIAS